MSQIDELRTTTANKDQEIMDCRKGIEKLQISVQQLTSQLEKDSKKISTLESKVDELSSSPLTFSFRFSTAKKDLGKLQLSEIFDSPSIPYQFQINALLENEDLFIWVSVINRSNIQSHKKISLEVFLINRYGDKVSKETTDDQNLKIHDLDNIRFKPLKLYPRSQWIINDHLQIFCRINRFNSLSILP